MQAGGQADTFTRPTYVRAAGGINSTQMQAIARAVVAEMPRGDVLPQFHAHPVQDMDPQTALTIMSREIGRQFAGLMP